VTHEERSTHTGLSPPNGRDGYLVYCSATNVGDASWNPFQLSNRTTTCHKYTTAISDSLTKPYADTRANCHVDSLAYVGS
jgi:hypothetical protein